MRDCITLLERRLSLDTFVETIVLADRVKDQGLHKARVDFAVRKENRYAANCVLLSYQNHRNL